MHNLLNAIKVQALLLMMLSMQCSLLHGMLSLGSKCKKLQKKLNVDKRFNRESLAEFVLHKHPHIIGRERWNKDLNKCAWITIDNSRFDHTKVHLHVVGVDGDHLKYVSKEWYDFYFPLIKDKGRPSFVGQGLNGLQDDVRPFFDKDGRACFYGFGYSAGYKDLSIIEYTLDFDGGERYRCLYSIPDQYGSPIQDCRVIFNFPVLVKALLQSKQVFKKYNQHDDPWKIFDIQGITLSKNYKDCHKDIPTYISLMTAPFDYSSYKQLPDYLQHAFNKQSKE